MRVARPRLTASRAGEGTKEQGGKQNAVSDTGLGCCRCCRCCRWWMWFFYDRTQGWRSGVKEMGETKWQEWQERI